MGHDLQQLGLVQVGEDLKERRLADCHAVAPAAVAAVILRFGQQPVVTADSRAARLKADDHDSAGVAARLAVPDPRKLPIHLLRGPLRIMQAAGHQILEHVVQVTHQCILSGDHGTHLRSWWTRAFSRCGSGNSSHTLFVFALSLWSRNSASFMVTTIEHRPEPKWGYAYPPVTGPRSANQSSSGAA